MAAVQTRWQLNGEYFENCSCDVVCPCLVSVNAPMTSTPTIGACEVAFAFHIDQGTYGDVTLDGLNVAMIGRSPGPMGEGNWSVGAYIDERADERQRAALGTVFGGQAGGPPAAFNPLIGQMLGVKVTPISYSIEGKRRSVEIPQIMSMTVRPLASLAEGQELWLQSGHPFAPERLALAVGEANNTVTDHGFVWDNSGKNAHYAPINWSNA